MVYEQTVKVSKDKAERLQALLDQGEIDFEKEDVEEDATLLTLTANFENGFSADIKVCSGQHNCYVDPVLFNENGNEVCVGEPSFDLLGEYDFEFVGNQYIVNVEIE